MRSKQLRYAVIGAGGIIGKTHLAALKRLGAPVVGLADLRLDTLTNYAAEIGCPVFADHRQLLAQVQPDVAVICTPHPSHCAIAANCLAAGLHVLVEKPVGVEVQEADQMIAAARQANRVLAVNFQHRLRPVIEKAKQFIDSGELGQVVRVLVLEPWLRTTAYYRSSDWRGTWTGEGGGVLLNQSPHTLDLMCHLVGLPAKVWGWVRTRYQTMECEDTAQAMLEYPNGAPGYFTASTAEAGGQRRIEIVGERATLQIAGDQLTIMRFTPPLREFITTSPELFGSPTTQSETLDLTANDTQGNHYAVYRDLEAAIAEGRPPRCDGQEGLMSLELANAIILSSFTQQAVTLPLDRTAYTTLLNNLKAGVKSL